MIDVGRVEPAVHLKLALVFLVIGTMRVQVNLQSLILDKNKNKSKQAQYLILKHLSVSAFINWVTWYLLLL